MAIRVLEAATIHAIHLLEDCRIDFSAVPGCNGADTVYIILVVHGHAEQDLHGFVCVHGFLMGGAKAL